MTVNEDIFVGSQANLAFVPELLLSGFIDESASTEATGIIAPLSPFTTMELVPNLYKGCTVEIFDASDFIAIKGIRALGNKLSGLPVTDVQLEPLDEEKEAQAQAAWEAEFAPSAEAPKAPKESPAAEKPADSAELEKPKAETTAPPTEPKTSTSAADDDAESPSKGGSIQPTLF